MVKTGQWSTGELVTKDMMNQTRDRHEMTMRIHCDTSELDAALVKADLLLAKVKEAEHLGIPIGVAATTLMLQQADKRIVSRRNLLFWWRK